MTDPDTFAAEELNWAVAGPSGAQWPGAKLDGLDPASSRALAGVAKPAVGAGAGATGDSPGEWTLEIWRPGLAGDEAVESRALKDILVVCHYSVHAAPAQPHV